MNIESSKAKIQQVDSTLSKAPDGGICAMVQVECGVTPGDSLSFGKYPDGDFVLAIVKHTGTESVVSTVVIAPETMRDLTQAIFQLVQS